MSDFIPEAKSLQRHLSVLLNASDEVCIASAFLSRNTLLTQLLEKRVSLSVVFRLDYPASPDFLDDLLDKTGGNQSLKFYRDRLFHPKVYLFKKIGQPIGAIVGSSNLTGGGMKKNTEANVLLTGNLVAVEKFWTEQESAAVLLTRKVIADYRKDYRPPSPPIYKQTKDSNRSAMEYREILDRWARVKAVIDGITPAGESSMLTFDLFCHVFKVRMKKDYQQQRPEKFDSTLLIDAYKLFLESEDYREYEKPELRADNIAHASKVLAAIKRGSIPTPDLRKFFASLHSVSYGSGSGDRKKHFKEIATHYEMFRLMDFLINSELSIEERIAMGLVEPAKGGEKIRCVGPSALREIPGWLWPDEYPIINNKFIETLNFFAA